MQPEVAGRRDHVSSHWQWLTETRVEDFSLKIPQRTKTTGIFDVRTCLKPWNTCRYSKPSSDPTTGHFSQSVRAIGATSSSDAHMARRCVGWSSAAIRHFIWELDMADWLWSRTQPQHLCCSSSHITAGPNKTLGCRHTRRAEPLARSCSNAAPRAPSTGEQRLCSETFRLHSFLWDLSL